MWTRLQLREIELKHRLTALHMTQRTSCNDNAIDLRWITSTMYCSMSSKSYVVLHWMHDHRSLPQQTILSDGCEIMRCANKFTHKSAIFNGSKILTSTTNHYLLQRQSALSSHLLRLCATQQSHHLPEAYCRHVSPSFPQSLGLQSSQASNSLLAVMHKDWLIYTEWCEQRSTKVTASQ